MIHDKNRIFFLDFWPPLPVMIPKNFHKMRNPMEEKLNTLLTESLNEISQASSENDLEEIRVKILGRKGLLTGILRSLG